MWRRWEDYISFFSTKLWVNSMYCLLIKTHISWFAHQTTFLEIDLLNNVKRRFSISIPVSLPLIMVHLHDSNEEENNHRQGRDKPRSMIIESIESIKMAWNAMNRMTPDIFFDTTGCAFSYTVARILAGCRVAAYVHYPTISTVGLS